LGTVPKRTKKAKKTCIEVPILRTTSGGGAEKYNRSAETEKIGAETAKIQSAKKSAETGGNLLFDSGLLIPLTPFNHHVISSQYVVAEHIDGDG
jgi:hypothetical protein